MCEKKIKNKFCFYVEILVNSFQFRNPSRNDKTINFFQHSSVLFQWIFSAPTFAT